MKKLLFYLPALLAAAFYGLILAGGVASLGQISPVVILWLCLLTAAGAFLNKKQVWGALPGLIPAAQLIFMGTRQTGQIVNEAPIGIVLFVFYTCCGFAVYRERQKK
ncbi:MAG: hypothetical protein PHG02_01525 [Oscillospiraceae bacterium]|nr:hypothetical protein [Oscillospiraceae bacterium]